MESRPSKESMRAGVAVYRSPGPGGIDVEIFTDDAYMQNLCREYWGRNDDSSWTIGVKALAGKYDISPCRVSQTVARPASLEVQMSDASRAAPASS